MSTIATSATSPVLSSLQSAGATKVDANTTAAQQDRFLTLLVTQMKNQDPLNPMDNAQITSQLAQLSTVNGIDKLNTTLTALQGNYQSSQSLQAASLIGHGVLLPGSEIALSQGKGVFGIDLTQAADNVKVTVRDASGKAIHTIDLGSREIGTFPLEWDGKTDTGATAADGTYKFDVQATRGEVTASATALTFGQINSVSTNAHGVKVNVANVGAVDIAQVRQFL
ncbi:MAG: flagellar hook assembly protein FlgD [Herminiimonas sp.]|nr:flagellar hook assembly protein FlgD [Herminiimonas sp.]